MRLAKIALAQARLAGRLSTFMSCAPAPAWSAPTRVRLSKPEGARMYSRVYPDAPRVGVGVVVLRHNPHTSVPEVLLIKRGTEPDKGKWCVPGGGLELGETVVECAAREVFEETGIVVRTASGTESLMGCGIVPQLGGCGVKAPFSGTGQLELPLIPTPFTSVDCITKDADGRIRFHYTIVEVAATPVDPQAAIKAMDDVDDIQWVEVGELRRLSPMVRQTAQVAEEAVRRFITHCC